MPEKLFSIWLSLYIVPFMLIAASWNRRSFFIIVAALTLPIGLLWIEHVSVPFEKQNIAYALGEGILKTISVGAAAGIVGRGVTLARGWRRFGTAGVTATILALMAAPLFLTATMTYDNWRRRPPAASCVARPSFAIEIASKKLSVPNWPFVTVSSGDEHFALSLPTDLRSLCAEVTDAPLVADSTTFFFDDVTSNHRPAIKAWSQQECATPTGIEAAFVCGQRPIEQLSIYADEDFKGRTIAYGRASSHAFFKEQQANGQYPSIQARRHQTAAEFPDGTWVFDDGSVFSCNQASSGYPSCRGDFELAPGLLAKAYFNAWNGDVEEAQRSARKAVERLYTETLQPTNR